MFRAKKIIIVFIILGSFIRLTAQGIGIEEWRDHLPYRNCFSVAQVGSRIYCSTKYSLFYYDKSDNSIGRLNRINGLSDVDISTIAFDPQSNFLLIAYNNANIDLLDASDNSIINIPDIKIKPIIGSKKINKVLFINKKAYLSCGFGIVVLDLIKKEIKDTYIIGENGTTIEVYGLVQDNVNFYATTEKGIYWALMSSPNLANYASWHKYTNINVPDAKYNSIVFFSNKLFVNKSSMQYNKDTIFVYDGNSWMRFDTIHTISLTNYNLKKFNDTLYIISEWGVMVYDNALNFIKYIDNSTQTRDLLIDSDGMYWLANSERGLIKILHSYENIFPNGPTSTNVVAMSVENKQLWVAPGGYELSSWTAQYNTEGIFSFIDEKWSAVDKSNTAGLDTIYDFISIVVDPLDSKRVYAGSWGRGLLEFYDSKLINIYNERNSPLRTPPAFGNFYWIGVGGVTFDKDHNLWISNMSLGCGEALIEKKANGEWVKFDLGSELNSSTPTRLMIDNNGQKWLMLSRGGGIAVYNEKNAGIKVKVLGIDAGKGKLPSPNVICFATDLDGKVWVGTDNGLSVFFTPENIFSGQNFDSQEILVEQDGHIRPLLEGEFITSIAVDGANRKWIGTQNSGVYLMSADGITEIYQFNTSNSPLISNTINCIAIDGDSGEVFFGTDKGIVSFKSTATNGGDSYDHVFAYPNPVREDYMGVIAIKGLVKNAIVKITDISGNLIYETIAEGGQAVWNGKNFNGEKAKTGVYLVFCTNDDGSKTEVTKILVIN